MNTVPKPNDKSLSLPDAPAPSWTIALPAVRGTLPNGTPMRRTDPSGSLIARVVILGVYPAALGVSQVTVDGKQMNLPKDVENESFAPGSESGAVLEEHYLRELGLARTQVLIVDMLPYYLANTTKNKSSGRSMADNFLAWEREAGIRSGVEARPTPKDLVRLARNMPGNLARLEDFLTRAPRHLMLTLGAEAAAFVRGAEYAAIKHRVDDLFYADPIGLTVTGSDVKEVVHLAHPHHFIKRTTKWTARHRAWCLERGRAIVRSALS